MSSPAATFQVPTNFVVQLVATEPNIQFPMFACLDEGARLYVAESSGLDLYAEISAGTRKCRVRALEDLDRDGTYETAEVFADKLIFPMGLAWRDGKLYVADPPELVTLEDTNRDGRADKRTVILSSFGAKDNGSLHGLVFGPDGLLYMTTGQPDGYEFKLPGGKVLKGHSGALIRCRADGSNPEIIARGFENLVEVVFLPGGEIIGTDNWYQKPSGGLRDALLHLVDGGLYPMQPDSATKYPITGDPLPALSMFPAVALSGLARYDGGQFPNEFRGNLFSAKHNTRSIGRHVLHRVGSTFRSDDSDFLTTDDPDFHPSDALVDRDGTLLVLDTGSWYTDHCPTGKIRKSPAKGGIYRVRYAGPQPASNPNTSSPADPDRIAAAVRIAGTISEMIELLSSPNPALQLAAAEALARRGDTSALQSLIAALSKPPDRFLEHALIHAIHRMVADSSTSLETMLAHDNVRVQKAALLLLSQPPRPASSLRVEAVLARTQSPDAELRRTAVALLTSRPAWSAEALRVAKDWLAQTELTTEQRAGLRALCTAFYSTGEFQDTLRATLENGRPAVRNLILEVLRAQPAPRKPSQWTPALRRVLHKGLLHERAEAARVAVAWRLNELKSDLSKIAGSESEPSGLRMECLRGLLPGYDILPDPIFDFLLSRFARGDALFASELLRKARLTDVQLTRLIRQADPLVPPATLLVAFRKSTSAQHTRALLQAVALIPTTGWNEAEYEEFAKRLPDEFRKEAHALRDRFRRERESQEARLARYEPLLQGGNPEEGSSVFGKVLCFGCHSVGEPTGNIGPDLTRIGAIRSGRDLLESILLPSSTFAQHYEPFVLETNDGEQHTGMIVDENEHQISFRTGAGSEMTFSRSAVRDLRRSWVSLMPEGLETGLTDQEFRDLLAYLQSLK